MLTNLIIKPCWIPAAIIQGFLSDRVCLMFFNFIVPGQPELEVGFLYSIIPYPRKLCGRRIYTWGTVIWPQLL